MGLKWVYTLCGICLILALSTVKCESSEKIDKFYKAIEKTGDIHGFNGELVLTPGENGDEIVYSHTLAENKGYTITYTGFSSKTHKDVFEKMAQGFGEMTKEIYKNAPVTKTSKKTIEGITLTLSDTAAQKLESVMYNTEIPRTRTLSFSPSSLAIISVRSFGPPIPDPVMKTLIAQLKIQGLIGQTETGEQFNVTVTAKGFVKKSTYFHSGDFQPNAFVLYGQVTDSKGQPVIGADIDVTSHKTSVSTDVNGQYRINIPFKTGSKPFNVNANFKLEPITTDMKIVIKTNPMLPVPGNTPVEITAETLDGKPVKGSVFLNIQSAPFVSAEQIKGILNSNGQWNTLIKVSKPGNLNSLPPTKPTFNVTITATIKPDDGGNKGLNSIEIPLNLSMITGVTIGPDMIPRHEKEPPSVTALNKEMFLGNTMGNNGEFRILVHPVHPTRGIKKSKWQIEWSDKNRLPLKLPLKTNPDPGVVVDLGHIDLLTPEEHIDRLKQTMIAFGKAMPLTPEGQSRLQKAIARLIFQDGSSNSVPVFRDNFSDDSGVIYIPGKMINYWGNNLLESNESDDPAYEILPHEMGHFVHHHIVERYNYRNVCYNDKSTGSHNTWSLEPGMEESKLPYMSFSENTADFFAILFRNFWVSINPDIKQSLYYQKKGYLHEFEDDSKAMDCISQGVAGYTLEGIQTRFLRVFYGTHTVKRPADIMNDYLNTMLLYMDTRTYTTGSLASRPARTISQWVYCKLMIPGAYDHADVLSVASRYRVNKLEPVPTASPTYQQKEVKFYVNGKNVDFGAYQVTPALYDHKLKLTKGMVGIDLSDFKTRRTLIMKAPCEIRLKSRTEIEVFRGIVSVDFPAVLLTPGGSVTPKGTVVYVNVDENGHSDVSVLDGHATIETVSGQTTEIETGQSIRVEKNGGLSTVKMCQPQEIYNTLLPDVKLPEVQASSFQFNLEMLQKQTKKLPWWGVLMVFMAVILLFVTVLFFLRFLLAALVTAPLIASLLVFLGNVILHPESIEHSGFMVQLMSPLEMFQIYSDWIPSVAWFVGAFLAGLMIRGGFKGFIIGLLFPLTPWIILHLPEGSSFPANLNQILEISKQIFGVSVDNFLTLLALSGLSSTLGGLLSPRKKQTKKTSMWTRTHQPEDHHDYDNSHENYDDMGDDE